MDKVRKFFKKLPKNYKSKVEGFVNQILANDLANIDVKKLKAKDNIFRARKGDLRVIYSVNNKGKATVLDVGWRDDTTYNFI